MRSGSQEVRDRNWQCSGPESLGEGQQGRQRRRPGDPGEGESELDWKNTGRLEGEGCREREVLLRRCELNGGREGLGQMCLETGGFRAFRRRAVAEKVGEMGLDLDYRRH